MEQKSDVYEENGLVVYRASSLGGCVRSLVAARLGESATPPHAGLQAAMDESSAAEDRAIKRYEQVTGHSVIWEQKEVELPIMMGMPAVVSHVVRGHIDGLDQEEDVIIEVKSLSRANFDKWNKDGWQGLGMLGLKYQIQAAVYGHATNRMVKFVILNKHAEEGPVNEAGEVDDLIIEPAYHPDAFMSMDNIAERVRTVEEFADRDELPDCDRACPPGGWWSHIHVYAGVTLDSSGDLDAILEQYDEVNRRIKDDTDLKESLREQLMDQYGVGKHATGRFNLNVSRVMSSRFDTTAFKKSHPELYEGFLTPSESVRVTVKRVGGDG